MEDLDPMEINPNGKIEDLDPKEINPNGKPTTVLIKKTIKINDKKITHTSSAKYLCMYLDAKLQREYIKRKKMS